jgi:hypothetical protein
MTLNFDVSRTDDDLIHQVVLRAEQVFNRRDVDLDRLSMTMDLCAVHNSVGLDLPRLLAADDFNLVHDVGGIRRHLDRSTGSLGCFMPRFAAIA